MEPTTRFPEGTFTPAPKRAPMGRVLAAQTKLESTLIWRHGEQMLLTMIIPLAMLVGFTLVPVLDRSDPIVTVFPMVLAVATMSAGFTGQAIAVGFDRRYGALKRLGATPIPRWGIIVGKSIAVLVVVIAQSVILGAIGVAFGWRPAILGLALGAVVIAIGTVCFAALGLLLGGTLKAEVVLALANLAWFALVGIGSLVVLDSRVPDAVWWVARCVPSGALTEALERASHGTVDVFGIGVLLVWSAVAAALAVRWFRFE